MGIPDEINRRIKQDPRLRAVMQKIEAGKADFTDTAHYFYRAADIRGEVLSEHVLEMPPEARTEACEGVLRKCYTDTCETLDGVQGALDDELGISIAPQHPDYPQERVEQVAQSLADPTVPDETIERRARSATANIAKSFHDAYMKENAGFRSRAGLKCYITRNSGGKCCDWCADLDGRYEYGSEPKDVYARHDNCSCSVTYENGRQRQNVWSKQTWEVPVVGAGAPEPVRYTAATAPQGFAPTVLTGGAKSGTMKLLDSIELFTGGKTLAQEQKKPLEEVLSKIPAKLLESLASYINKIEIVDGRGYSSYNRESRNIILDKDTGHKSIIHELGHAFGEMLGLYGNEKYLEIVADGLELDDWGQVMPIPHPYKPGKFVYVLISEATKILDPYQLRIYAEPSNYDWENDPIPASVFLEYISVSFDAYFSDREKLREKDPKMFEYLEELINGIINEQSGGTDS